MSTSVTTCTVGCGSDGTSCGTFTPSNNLGASLLSAASAAPITIPAGSTIDTDTGVVTAPDMTSVNAMSTIVTEASVMIRVFAAPLLTLSNLTIIGSLPIAFVASGTIEVDGLLDLSGNTMTSGPGAAGSAAQCNGVSANIIAGPPRVGKYGGGGGGGGDATAGGGAGLDSAGGGIGEVGFDPLTGGCAGGAVYDGTTEADFGGGGGGAIQLVSNTGVSLHGIIHVGGGGGGAYAGGGAAGIVVIEAPTVTVAALAGIAANGGGGGACGGSGADATPDANAATGGACAGSDNDGSTGGSGGIASSTAGSLNAGTGNGSDFQFFGGGGGAAGRARIATVDGTIQSDPSAVMSAVLTSDTLVVQ
jgi:hypothetical protein